MNKQKRIPTPEEYEKDKQVILSSYRAGLPQRRMIDKFGYTITYITKMRSTLINEGLITEEEIKSASAQYFRENPAAQGLDKSKVRKPKGNEKAEKRHNQSLENKEKVFELVKQKYAKSQIARTLKITETAVEWHIKALIEDGRIQRDEVEKASSQSGVNIIDKTAPEYLAQRDQIVECLRKGWKNHNIRKEFNITSYDFNIYMKDIKYRKIMTSEQIKSAREKKRQEDLQFVADSVNDGLTISQIRDLKPEFSYNEVTPMIRELIVSGVITQEQVDENTKNGSKQTNNKSLKMSADEQVQFILDKVRKGYAPEEIVKSDETKSLSMHKVLYQKRQLIAKGVIFQEEADEAMKKRQAKALERKHKKVIKKIKEYTELGYTLSEISELITEYSYSYLVKLKSDYIKEHGWYTEEELEEFVNLRRKREAEEAQRAFDSLPPEEKRKIEEARRAEAQRLEDEKKKRQEEILERRQVRKDETSKQHQEDVEKLKQHLKSGKTMKMAAELMGVSIPYIYQIRRESIQNKTWLTEKELKAIDKKRNQKQERKKEERKKKKIDEQNRKREENELRIRKEIWKLREYVEQGCTYAEISRNMNYSVSHLTYLRKLAIADNIWFSKEAIDEFKRLREIREAEEAEKRQKEEQARLDKERREAEKAIKEAEQLKKAFEKERKRKIRGYSESYKKYRKAAKKEDNLELDGEENVSTEGRKNFIKILTSLHSLDADISDKDIEIVLNTFDLYPEMADKESIKFLISDASKKGGLKAAEKMTIALINTLRNTKFYEPLIEYRRWMVKQALLPKIQAMKGQNMSNDDIGKKLGISSLEVSRILYNDKKPDFFDSGNR